MKDVIGDSVKALKHPSPPNISSKVAGSAYYRFALPKDASIGEGEGSESEKSGEGHVRGGLARTQSKVRIGAK